ncbi:hypothetical protein, partial [Idiomarina sp.]|uniref:hypothetical protein n=1 Tax=Idiomarina sp. TaxID=1874361 RepID=UPI003516ABBF
MRDLRGTVVIPVVACALGARGGVDGRAGCATYRVRARRTPASRHKKTPATWLGSFYLKSGGVLLSHGETPHYHR